MAKIVAFIVDSLAVILSISIALVGLYLSIRPPNGQAYKGWWHSILVLGDPHGYTEQPAKC
jgi:hypothetical protein